MPTNHDETLLERYQREHRAYEGMMMSKHTDGPIRYEYEPGYCGELIAVDGMTVCAFTDEPSEANARRLVACWNALEDLSQDALDGGWTRAGLEAYGLQMKSERDRLSAINAELLEALTSVTIGCSGLHHNKHERHALGNPCPVESRIRAAIAKAQGEQP